jgi:hypothetical protein
MFVDLGGLRAFQEQPALFGPGRRQFEGLSERHHLVRVLRRSHLAGGPDHNRCRKVKPGRLEEKDNHRHNS